MKVLMLGFSFLADGPREILSSCCDWSAASLCSRCLEDGRVRYSLWNVWSREKHNVTAALLQRRSQ